MLRIMNLCTIQQNSQQNIQGRFCTAIINYRANLAYVSIIPHNIEEMGMAIIPKLLFLHSLLASNVQIFVCVFLSFHLSLILSLYLLFWICVFFCFLFPLCVFSSSPPVCKRLLCHWSRTGLHKDHPVGCSFVTMPKMVEYTKWLLTAP